MMFETLHFWTFVEGETYMYTCQANKMYLFVKGGQRGVNSPAKEGLTHQLWQYSAAIVFVMGAL